MRPSRPVTALALLAVVAVGLVTAGLAGCKGSRQSGDLPAGDTLLSESAAAMRVVNTVRFAIESDGTVGGLALRRAGGQLTKEGNAKGNAQIGQGGASLDLEFVVVGDSIYIKGLTGGWQKLPLALASGVYDPSAILDPERGIAKVLSSATDAKTEGRERVGGVDTYRVAAKLNATDLATIVPGVGEGVTGKLWLAADTKRLVKATFAVPASGGEKPVNVTVTFTEFDAPVNISAP